MRIFPAHWYAAQAARRKRKKMGEAERMFPGITAELKSQRKDRKKMLSDLKSDRISSKLRADTLRQEAAYTKLRKW